MFQGFPGDPDSRGSTSPSLESQYLSSVESFGSPPTTSAPQVSHSIYSRFNIVFVRANCFAKQHGSCEMCLFLLDKRSDVAKRMRFNSFECLDVLSRNRIQQNTDKSACARNQVGSNVVGLQHAAKQMTNPWKLSGVRTRSSALRSALLLSLLVLRRDVNAFYFGVLRCVAKGNTGGATGAEYKGREGLLEAAYWLRCAACAFA